ncbi:MAG: DUF4394 domain-containing protein [Blastocatellia bacterium]|nr:DUF4394 domain-containing protein [Blastocatellia bacterium]
MKRIIVLSLLLLSVGAIAHQSATMTERAQQPAVTIYGITAANNLISFSASAPGTILSSVAITGLAQGETLTGIDFRPRNNQLYGVSSANRIYTINLTTGAATAAGTAAFTPALSGTAFGVDFNPVPDRIRLVSDAEQNLRLHPDTGAVAGTDAALSYATGDVNAGANPNLVGAAYTNNFNAPSSTTLYAIDSNLDILVRQGSTGGAPDSPNNGRLTTIGALGVNTGDQVGFDILAPNDVAFASMTAQGAGSSSLYSINLNTGAATAIGGIGGTAVVRDIAIPVTFIPSAQQAGFAIVNAASFTGDTLAPEEIAAIFGNFQTQNNQPAIASTLPLPTTLGGVKVTVNGTDAPLFFAAPGQINIRIPANTADGQATVAITDATGATRPGTVSITRAAPGLFTVNGNGVGTAFGLSTTDGVTFLPLADANRAERPVDPGTRARPTYLIFFGTGIRNARAENPADANGVAEAVTATIQGVPATVAYAGRHPDFEGLDQINVILPPELAGFGRVRARLVINGQPSNFVTVSVGGAAPAINLAAIAAGQTIGGALSADDQVLRDEAGRTYFFDAYRFTATAGTGIAVDVRSTVFDAAAILYKRNGDGSLTPLASDDDLGGLGDGAIVNGNALLLTALQESGEYVIFVTSATSDENGQGGYTVRLAGNAIQQIAYGANLTAAIAGGDLQTAAGVLLDGYFFAGTAGDRVQIQISSPSFDPLLLLSRNTGDPLAFDDNGGGGTSSLLTTQLPATGVYVIVATPFAANAAGGYTLSLSRATTALQADQAEPLSSGAGRPLLLKQLDPERMEEARFGRFATRRVIERQ